MAKTVASKKGKARRVQNPVRDALQEFAGMGEDDIWAAPMGVNGMDIKLSKAAREIVPFAFECTNSEKLRVWDKIKQAERNAEGLTPILAFKRNRSDIYVTLRFSDFMKLLKKAYGRLVV